MSFLVDITGEDNSELTWLLSGQSLFTAVCDLVFSLELKMQKRTMHFFRSLTLKKLLHLKPKDVSLLTTKCKRNLIMVCKS